MTRSAEDVRAAAMADAARYDLVARRRTAIARGVAVALPLVVQEASGSVLRDGDGREVIDFAGGIGCVNVGHAHPAVVAAIAAQAARYTHACFQVATYEPYVALAERLNALVPGPGPRAGGHRRRRVRHPRAGRALQPQELARSAE